jgi:hypothetical protein
MAGANMNSNFILSHFHRPPSSPTRNLTTGDLYVFLVHLVYLRYAV